MNALHFGLYILLKVMNTYMINDTLVNLQDEYSKTQIQEVLD